MKISKTLLLSALAVCVMALPASAVPAFQPDTGNTDQGTLSGTDAIDGALGVNRLFDDTNDNVTDSTDTVDGTVGNGNVAYASSLRGTTYPGTLTFGFDNPVSMDTFYLWNISHGDAQFNTREFGIKDFELKLYDGSSTLLTTVSSLTAAIAPVAGVPIPSQSFDLGGLWAGVESVELIVASNQGGNPSGSANDDFNFFGAREVAFSVVPEPTSAALLLGGVFGLLGARRRRR